jgi:hypothetical protein
MGLEPTTPCLQSETKAGVDLRSVHREQGSGGPLVTVTDRLEPAVPDRLGTYVARRVLIRCWARPDALLLETIPRTTLTG